MDFEKLLIKDYKNWQVKLHHNQNYLGKCVLWFKGDEKDFIDLNEEEREEFFEITKKLKEVLKELFNPDLFNYLSLNNKTKHLHFHIMPRYKEKRIFNNKEFLDDNFGKPPFREENLLPEKDLELLKNKIKEKLI